MRISDWSSDVCSSDLVGIGPVEAAATEQRIDADAQHQEGADGEDRDQGLDEVFHAPRILRRPAGLNRPGDAITRQSVAVIGRGLPQGQPLRASSRSEEHTSELQSLMRISYAVFSLKKKKHTKHITNCAYKKE